MDNPLRVLTSSYDLICTNLGCDHRLALSMPRKARAAALTLARVMFLMLCSGFIGASVAVLVHAQSTNNGERIARVESTAAVVSTQVTTLQEQVFHLQSQVATMSGIGIGLGAALTLLQILQMILGRKPA
jgi:uncharacterized protein YlxW (UPF0749 family)